MTADAGHEQWMRRALALADRAPGQHRLGALAGASTNYVYTRYYTEMAHVHFGLRRLAGDTGIPPDQLKRQLAGVLGHPT